CHCRMCQKAFGSFFAPLVGVLKTDIRFTRGSMARFRSSDATDRGFCEKCGTPLSFEYLESKYIAVSIGSLDHPERVEPHNQYGLEARMPWFADLSGLPGSATTEDEMPDKAAFIQATNHQHPDHDTTEWPMETHR
ncbi:MAG: GFA family protein, partial [Hyphomicrobiaceae bacterium]|nr:GFA family protein [Hyphomicrobiaceae bacterium]